MPSAVVTGANSGIGFSLCKHLLSTFENLDLYLLCRNEKRAKDARDKLLVIKPTSRITIIICDVSAPKSVVEAADVLKNKLSQIDYLYLNAGCMPRTRINWPLLIPGRVHWKTLLHILNTGDRLLTQDDFCRPDGLQDIFATNVFGHFILYEELEHLLTNGRVIWTSSRNAMRSSFNIADIQHHDGHTAYSSSKYLIDLLSYYIHEQRRVTSAVACPGLVLTNLTYGIISQFLWYAIYPLAIMMRLFSDIVTLCPDAGASSLLYLSRIEHGQVDAGSKYCTVKNILGITSVRLKKMEIEPDMAENAYREMERLVTHYFKRVTST